MNFKYQYDVIHRYYRWGGGYNSEYDDVIIVSLENKDHSCSTDEGRFASQVFKDIDEIREHANHYHDPRPSVSFRLFFSILSNTCLDMSLEELINKFNKEVYDYQIQPLGHNLFTTKWPEELPGTAKTDRYGDYIANSSKYGYYVYDEKGSWLATVQPKTDEDGNKSFIIKPNECLDYHKSQKISKYLNKIYNHPKALGHNLFTTASSSYSKEDRDGSYSIEREYYVYDKKVNWLATLQVKIDRKDWNERFIIKPSEDLDYYKKQEISEYLNKIYNHSSDETERVLTNEVKSKEKPVEYSDQSGIGAENTLTDIFLPEKPVVKAKQPKKGIVATTLQLLGLKTKAK